MKKEKVLSSSRKQKKPLEIDNNEIPFEAQNICEDFLFGYVTKIITTGNKKPYDKKMLYKVEDIYTWEA